MANTSVRFLAFHCPAAPAGRQWLGQIFVTPHPTPKNENPGEVPLNLNLWAGSRADAIGNAEAWWSAEQQKIADREAKSVARAANARSRKDVA